MEKRTPERPQERPVEGMGKKEYEEPLLIRRGLLQDITKMAKIVSEFDGEVLLTRPSRRVRNRGMCSPGKERNG